MKTREKLEKNIAYLQRAVPADDIYLFAELNYDASTYLLTLLNDLINVDEAMQNDNHLNKIVINIISYFTARLEDKEIQLDLGIYDNN